MKEENEQGAREKRKGGVRAAKSSGSSPCRRTVALHVYRLRTASHQVFVILSVQVKVHREEREEGSKLSGVLEGGKVVSVPVTCVACTGFVTKKGEEEELRWLVFYCAFSGRGMEEVGAWHRVMSKRNVLRIKLLRRCIAFQTLK
ncbi:hypothetical protein E2C01_002858 [Portunus trituberculatus]|uniref:Uncharacterized protein n=1 Tax=Portunus trituberculatus TaxID=210409 RepID=A0A5B7CPB1_PORTR|nr:hypothetical protein [Portunus trituberculatus]